MPMGYNSLVGDMGTSLSGGQKQRILLARALYKRPAILFLDEATSHLDISLERDISGSIAKMQLTRIVIAHRPETIRTSGRVLDISKQSTRTESLGKKDLKPRKEETNEQRPSETQLLHRLGRRQAGDDAVVDLHQLGIALLGAFDLIRDAGVDVDLTIVGRNGWMSDEIAEAIRRHPQYGRSLTWVQGATDNDVLEIARRCRVAVVPSQAEGFGLFLEEALSLGLAVVASDIPPFLERPYPNVTFSDPASPALAEAILRVRDEPVVPLVEGQVRALTATAHDLVPIIVSALGR